MYILCWNASELHKGISQYVYTCTVYQIHLFHLNEFKNGLIKSISSDVSIHSIDLIHQIESARLLSQRVSPALSQKSPKFGTDMILGIGKIKYT